MLLISTLISLIFLSPVYCNTDGAVHDECVLQETGESSICILLKDCDSAKNELKQNKFPQRCGFVGKQPIVCCPKQQKQQRELQIGDLARRACASFYDLHWDTESDSDKSGCYLNYRGVIECPVAGGELVINLKDFKHMALIGFDDGGERNWQCGGSLISERYVLTAAHCLTSRQLGRVKYVRLGDLDYKTDTDNTTYQDFTITKIIRHPNYTYTNSYNDIALLELDRAAVFGDFVRPACLQTETMVNDNNGVFMVAGWGATQYNGASGSSQLRKAAVEIVPPDTCRDVYPVVSRTLNRGIVDELQICAGTYNDEGSTCKGDSGGPLQLDATIEKKPFSFIVGVTSFGKACGFKGIPGVYTRVSNYIGWIEGIVWKTKA